MTEKLDATYKLAKIISLVIGVLALASTTVAGVAVGHYRIEALHISQIQAKTEREEMRKEIRDLDKALNTIQTDISWIRKAMEEKQR